MANVIRELLEKEKNNSEYYDYFLVALERYTQVCTQELCDKLSRRLGKNGIKFNAERLVNAIKKGEYDVSVSLSFDKMLEIFDRVLPNEESRFDRVKIIQDFILKFVDNVPFNNMISVDDGILSITISVREHSTAYAGYYNELVYKRKVIKTMWNDEEFISHLRHLNIKKNWISREWLEDDSKCSALYHEIKNLNEVINVAFKNSINVYLEGTNNKIDLKEPTFESDYKDINQIIPAVLFDMSHLEALISDVCLEMKNAYVTKMHFSDPMQYEQYLKTKELLVRAFDKVHDMDKSITKKDIAEYSKVKYNYANGINGQFAIV